MASGSAAFPSFVRGVGPFPTSVGNWRNKPADAGDQRAVTGLYLALMADTSLELIGSRDRLLIEGRFAEAVVFTRALATFTAQPARLCLQRSSGCGVWRIAAAAPQLPPPCNLTPVEPLQLDLSTYACEWRARAHAGQRLSSSARGRSP